MFEMVAAAAAFCAVLPSEMYVRAERVSKQYNFLREYLWDGGGRRARSISVSSWCGASEQEVYPS